MNQNDFNLINTENDDDQTTKRFDTSNYTDEQDSDSNYDQDDTNMKIFARPASGNRRRRVTHLYPGRITN